jgi:hypothetical protein
MCATDLGKKLDTAIKIKHINADNPGGKKGKK